MWKPGVSISPELDSVPGRVTRTDGQTDRRTDRIAVANTRSQQYLPVQLSRVKSVANERKRSRYRAAMGQIPRSTERISSIIILY